MTKIPCARRIIWLTLARCRGFGGENCRCRNAQAGGSQQQVNHRTVSQENVRFQCRRTPCGNGRFIEVTGARENNLQNITARFPLGNSSRWQGSRVQGSRPWLTASSKKPLLKKLNRNSDKPGKFKTIWDWAYRPSDWHWPEPYWTNTEVQSCNLYRCLWWHSWPLAQTNEAQIRGYKKVVFSFNVKGGRWGLLRWRDYQDWDALLARRMRGLWSLPRNPLQQWNPEVHYRGKEYLASLRYDRQRCSRIFPTHSQKFNANSRLSKMLV